VVAKQGIIRSLVGFSSYKYLFNLFLEEILANKVKCGRRTSIRGLRDKPFKNQLKAAKGKEQRAPFLSL